MKEGLVGLRVQVGLIILGCSFFWNLGIPFWYHTLDGLNQTDAGLRAHAPILNNTYHIVICLYTCITTYLHTYIHTYKNILRPRINLRYVEAKVYTIL